MAGVVARAETPLEVGRMGYEGVCDSCRLGVLLALFALLAWVSLHSDWADIYTHDPVPEEVTPVGPRLDVLPSAPRISDSIKVLVGRNEDAPVRQPDRASRQAVFYDVVDEVPEEAVYELGALRPGSYKFVLLRQVGEEEQCVFEELVELEFSVHEAAVTADQHHAGKLILLLETESQASAFQAVASEKVKVSWLFDMWARALIPPGMERSYRDLFARLDGVTNVDLDWIGSIPECPPPFGPAYSPGRLAVRFDPELSREQVEQLVAELPPRLTRWESGYGDVNEENATKRARSRAWVSVPPGWEEWYLQRYLALPQVLGGRVDQSVEMNEVIRDG